jgi:hypothetical protein
LGLFVLIVETTRQEPCGSRAELGFVGDNINNKRKGKQVL